MSPTDMSSPERLIFRSNANRLIAVVNTVAVSVAGIYGFPHTPRALS